MNIYLDEKDFPINCWIKSIQEHDKKLVKKICDEIYERAFDVKLIGNNDIQIFNKNTKYAQVIENIDKYRLKNILDEIREKYEKVIKN